MELLVKIVNKFKQKTIFVKGSILDVSQVLSSPLTTFFTNNKRIISRFFGTVIPTTPLGLYLFKVNDRNIKNTRARCEMCLKIIVRTPDINLVSIVNFQQILDIQLVFPLVTLSK